MLQYESSGRTCDFVLHLKYPSAFMAHPPGGTSGHLATQKLGQGLQGWSVGHFLQCANDWQLSQAGIQAFCGGVRQFPALPGEGLTFPPPQTHVSQKLSKHRSFHYLTPPQDNSALVFSGQVLK